MIIVYYGYSFYVWMSTCVVLFTIMAINDCKYGATSPLHHQLQKVDAFLLLPTRTSIRTMKASYIHVVTTSNHITTKRSASRCIILKMIDTVSSSNGDSDRKSSSSGNFSEAPTTTSSTNRKTNRNSQIVQQQLENWAKSVNIQIASNIHLSQFSEENDTPNKNRESSSGYGWYVSKTATPASLNSGQVLLTVPSSVALVVETSSSENNNVDTALPWFGKMAIELHKLVRQKSFGDKNDIDYRPWVQSLPTTFDTPIHWKDTTILNLQYKSLQESVQEQRTKWKMYYSYYIKQVGSTSDVMSYDQFVWGCECARSRAFTGSYSGAAYNPNIFLFTLLLVTIYVGGNFGTLEQAANGAGVVVAASILKDFVLPKFYPTKKYIICPMIDMTNHNSKKAQTEVAFEYFSNVYSLSIKQSKDATTPTLLRPTEQLYMSYGPRSNDQLLQYYGFVEVNNPHDVYILPPIRDWDINHLERICGRQFQPGRLQKLDDVGLLGSDNIQMSGNDGDDDYDDSRRTAQNGVVVSRNIGLDPAILQALRVLVSTDSEWEEAGRAIGNFSVVRNPDNEQCALLVAITVIEMELRSKTTTLEDDIKLLRSMNSMKSMVQVDPEDRLVIQFRIEKKSLLVEMMDRLKRDLKNYSVDV